MAERDRGVKLEFQIRQLAKTAAILSDLFAELAPKVRVGSDGLVLQSFVKNYLISRNAHTALKGYRGFTADVSISVNSVAAHGIPDDRKFRPGDLITVDVAAVHDGWYGDMAWTFGIPPLNVTERRLIRAAWQACMAGCLALQPDLPVGTLGAHVVNSANRLGARVVNSFCGHSIGMELHEKPLIPYASTPGNGWLIREGMVLNIEPVVTLGSGEVDVNYDGISYGTRDGATTAQFELTSVVTPGGVRILSLPGYSVEDIFEYPPF